MKKILSSLLAAAAAVTLFTAVPAAAASSAWQKDAEMTALLSELNIMVGDDNGNFNLDNYVSRAEMAKIAIASSSAKNTVALGLSFSPFSDVKGSFWGAPYIQAAVSAGIVDGYIDGTFRPDGTVKYEEAINMMLKVLGYSNTDFGASYPYGQVGMAESLKMTEGMNAEIGRELTRRQVALLVCNTLDTALKGTNTDLISVHDCAIIEDVTIIASHDDDVTLASDEISTTSGKYRIRNNFNDEYVGSRGDMVVKDGKYFVAFSPDGTMSSAKYVIYSTLNDAILAYPAGNNTNMQEFTISSTTTCYKDSTAYTYGSLRSSMEMGDTIRIRYKDNGEIDYINYSEGTLEGPIKVSSDTWAQSFDTDAATKIMRDGTRVTSGDIKTNDIVYYSDALNMVLAYSKKITGVYENASPSKDSPQTVTVSGVTYEVEGVQAFNDLSSSGPFSFGDTITLLMGKDGSKVAGVMTAGTTATDVIIGYVTGSGQKTFNNSDGTSYTSYYVDVVTPDGTSYTYPTEYNKSVSVNKVVRIQLKNGYAEVSNINTSSSLSGYVSYQKMQIGSKKVASNASIIDISKLASSDAAIYARIFMQRLDGITLKESNVAYYTTNKAGEIDELILQNVTGDMYDYGIVSHATRGADGSYTYTIQSDNKNYTTSRFSLISGSPVQFALNGAEVAYAFKLSSYPGTVTGLTQSYAEIGSERYLLSDKVRVYRKQDLTYLEMSLNEAISGSYKYSCYYDRTEANGGRIRVIVCTEK